MRYVNARAQCHRAPTARGFLPRMSSSDPPVPPPDNPAAAGGASASLSASSAAAAAAAPGGLDGAGVGFTAAESALPDELAGLTTAQIRQRTAMLATNLRVLGNEQSRIREATKTASAHLKENEEKIKLNKTLPYLVANVVELLDHSPEELEEMAAERSASNEYGFGGGSAAAAAAEPLPPSKAVVIKTTMRQTVYLPVAGLVDTSELKPGDLIGTNKDSFLILEKLCVLAACSALPALSARARAPTPPSFFCTARRRPTEYDPRVKAMELDEKPTEDYSDVGGADKQIQELIEAIVLPMTHAERFKKLGVHPPKGVLLHGRACGAAAASQRARAPLVARPHAPSPPPPPLPSHPQRRARARRCWRAPAPRAPTPSF